MLFDTIYRARLLVYVTVGLIVVASGIGITKLAVSTDNRIFYGPDNPYYQDYLDFEAEFANNESILFVIAAPYRIGENNFPAAIRWLTNEAQGLDHVTRVDSLANYPHPLDSGEDELLVQSLLDWACDPAEQCTSSLYEELSNPNLVNRFVNPAQTATGILATVSIERGAVGEIEGLQAQTEDLAEDFEKRFPEFEVHFTGGVPMMAAFAEATADDLSLLLPAAFIVISILLGLVLGSLGLAASIIFVGLCSIVVTLGFAGWWGHTINNATSIIPVIVFTLVVTSSMHIAVHYSRNIRANLDASRARDQVKASLTSSATPIFLSAATSAASLCSLWFVDSPPIRQLGLFSAIGVTVGYILTVILLPLLMISVRRTSQTQINQFIQGAVNRYSRRLELGSAPVRSASICFLLFASGISMLSVNEDFVRFFDESVPFRQQTDRATELLAGPNHIEVVVSNPNGSVFDPEYLQYTEQLTTGLRANRYVANAHSFSDVMQQVAKAFSSGAEIDGTESADELAQLFLVYELSLQQGQSNSDLINATQDSSRISVLLKDTSSSQIQELEEGIYAVHASANVPYALRVTGENIPVAHLSWMNIQAMITGIFLSLSFTAFVVGAAFRSFRLGVTALLATVVPVLGGFGAWGWIHGDIGLAATAVIALTIGVVVDDAAHYIYRFLDARSRLELDPWAAAAYACHRAGAAIVGTSVVMGLGLSVLLLSSFAVNSSFGAVACLIIISALAFNLAILPRLTVWAVGSPRNVMESVV